MREVRASGARKTVIVSRLSCAKRGKNHAALKSVENARWDVRRDGGCDAGTAACGAAWTNTGGASRVGRPRLRLLQSAGAAAVSRKARGPCALRDLSWRQYHGPPAAPFRRRDRLVGGAITPELRGRHGDGRARQPRRQQVAAAPAVAIG